MRIIVTQHTTLDGRESSGGVTDTAPEVAQAVPSGGAA